MTLTSDAPTDRAADLDPWVHQPGLDGLRAIAVGVVLLYHGRIAGVGGGFLGVSAFFTLSGFLITSLLLREFRRNQRIDLQRFWGRRVRRLVPAALLTQALIVLLAVLGVWDGDQLRSLRGDVPAALLQILNWHFVLGDRTYGDLFASPSPLEHFWSLAVEEQFYFVFPLLLTAALVLGRGRLKVLVATLLAATCLSAFLNGWLATASTDRAYFGTDTRLAELTVGALLACMTLPGVIIAARWRRWAIAVGVIGATTSVVLWSTATTGSAWLYPWGLLLTAGATSSMIVAALQPGWFAAALSTPPLQWLGRISYGVYLLHWPIFLWLTPVRTGLGAWPLLGIRLAITLLAAEVMFRLVEQPVRSRRRLRGRALAALPAAAVVVLLAAMLSTQDLPGPTPMAQAAAPGPTTTFTSPPRAQRVLLLGDELAASLGATWAPPASSIDLRVAAAPGCGLMVAGWVRLGDGSVERDSDRCGKVHDQWVATEQSFRPDVVIIWAGVRDLADRRLRLEEPWLRPGEPALDDVYATEASQLADRLGAGGAQVAWLTVPVMRATTSLVALAPSVAAGEAGDLAQETLALFGARQGVPPPGFAENDDSRVLTLNALLRSVVQERPNDQLIDIASRMARWPGGALDPAQRPDGVGLADSAGASLGRWLAARLDGATRAVGAAPVAPEQASVAPAPPEPQVGPRRVATDRPVRTLVVGDSVALDLGGGLSTWSDGRGELIVDNRALLGCPVARGGSYRYLGEIFEFGSNCDWAAARPPTPTLPELIGGLEPDVVVMTTGIWEVVDRILPGERRWRNIGDPVVDGYLRAELLRFIDVAAFGGATVLVADFPHIQAGSNQGYVDLPESDPARMDRLNEILREVVAARPQVARLVPFREWLAAQPGGELDPLKRRDGVHFRPEYLPTIGAWLGPQVVAAGRAG